jgi:hypothetical protein
MTDGGSRASCKLERFSTLTPFVSCTRRSLSETGTPDPGNSCWERFVYEIMLMYLEFPLTNLDGLSKMRDIQGTKEKTTSELSKLWTGARSC